MDATDVNHISATGMIKNYPDVMSAPVEGMLRHTQREATMQKRRNNSQLYRGLLLATLLLILNMVVVVNVAAFPATQ